VVAGPTCSRAVRLNKLRPVEIVAKVWSTRRSANEAPPGLLVGVGVGVGEGVAVAVGVGVADPPLLGEPESSSQPVRSPKAARMPKHERRPTGSMRNLSIGRADPIHILSLIDRPEF